MPTGRKSFQAGVHDEDIHTTQDIAVGLQGPRGIRLLAAAGVLGPVLFTVGFLLLGLLRRGEYDPVAEQVSNLTSGPWGWAQQANFIVFGLLLLAFAAGLHRGMWSTRGGVAGPALLGCNGVGLVLAGLFPLREDAAGRVYDPIGVHSINGRIFFLSIGIALVVVSLRLRRDPSWRGLAPYTIGTGIALLVVFVVVGALAVPADGPLHNLVGPGAAAGAGRVAAVHRRPGSPVAAGSNADGVSSVRTAPSCGHP
jgi:hypothetical membrane protein